MSTKNILIIEDHPLVYNSYLAAFKTIESKFTDYKFVINISENCDDAIKKINESVNNCKIDLVLLDISIPPSIDKLYLSGEDIGVYLKEVFPDSKIIVLTTFNDNFRIYSIIQNLNPDGFLVKNDVTIEILMEAINKVISHQTFYSKSVLEFGRKIISQPYVIDKIDRQMLHEISKGAKMSELPKKIPMSIGGLERRKRNLKIIFGLGQSNTDRELIEKAEEIGFL